MCSDLLIHQHRQTTMAGVPRKFCAHCEELLAPRTFREHQRLYYDSESRSWTKKMKKGAADPLTTEDSSSYPCLEEDDNPALMVYLNLT